MEKNASRPVVGEIMFEDRGFELWYGNCLELMNRIDDKSVDMILCDLPYRVTANNKWDTIIQFELTILVVVEQNYWELSNKIGHIDFWTDLCNQYNIPLNQYLPKPDFDMNL